MYRYHEISIYDDFTKFTLCYPEFNCEELRYRVDYLINSDFKYLIEFGRKFLNYNIVGKGYSSIIVLAQHEKHGLGLIKVRRIDSRRDTLEYEGIILDYLEKTSFVPRIFHWSRDFIFMEYLDKCMPVDKILVSIWISRDIAGILHVIRKVINALYIFDLLGVDHTELNRPYGHIYWCDDVVKVIDWESSRLSSKPSNLTSFISYLLYRSVFSRDLAKHLSSELKQEFSNLLKNYKNSRNPLLVKEIFMFLEQLLHQQF